MRINEILSEASPKGRAFNHLEDLVFFYGSEGALEAIRHLEDIATTEGASSIRMKWDGCVHADSVLITSQGDMTIKELIESATSSIYVLGRDLDNKEDVMTKVLATNATDGDKEWISVEFENNQSIILTEDHEVFTTNRGWVAAGKLTSEDDVQSIKCDGNHHI